MTDFWASPLADTLLNSRRLATNKTRVRDVGEWLSGYEEDAPVTSNQGAENLPFQRWFHFKEAFSPKFVADTLSALPYPVENCLDPFGGSGTTAMTCRMLGIGSTTIEVNPFLADLIESKVRPPSASEFSAAYERLLRTVRVRKADGEVPPGMPPTITEPGVGNRFVFPLEIYQFVRALVRASSEALSAAEARLFRVMLGSVLVDASNVVVNGKGRRYRRNWQSRQKTKGELVAALDEAVDRAIADLTAFSGLPRGKHKVIRGDSRAALAQVTNADVAVFSPPYPNSFDYTDVYNLELWMLGYLGSGSDNHVLRHQTLRSHVQLKWRSTPRVVNSRKLDSTLRALRAVRADLWNPNIPEMVGYYFDDLFAVFEHLARILPASRHVVVAIGDSQYGGVHIDVAAILSQVAAQVGFVLEDQGAVRSMRNSSQHGGGFELSEHCLVFKRV